MNLPRELVGCWTLDLTKSQVFRSTFHRASLPIPNHTNVQWVTKVAESEDERISQQSTNHTNTTTFNRIGSENS